MPKELLMFDTSFPFPSRPHKKRWTSRIIGNAAPPLGFCEQIDTTQTAINTAQIEMPWPNQCPCPGMTVM
jgi:hypothetical protein